MDHHNILLGCLELSLKVVHLVGERLNLCGKPLEIGLQETMVVFQDTRRQDSLQREVFIFDISIIESQGIKEVWDSRCTVVILRQYHQTRLVGQIILFR